MPKKRVGVSLRKPSPAPETVLESVAVDPVSVEPIASDDAADSAPSTLVMPHAAGERPSEIVALRKAAPAPLPAEAKAIDAFVNGAAAAFERVATEVPTARLAEVLQRGFEGYRELVAYLPAKLAQQLSLHCLERGLDMSRVVAAALEQHLAGASDSASVAAQRRADESPAGAGLLSLAARALVGELAAWARSVWARRRSAAGTVSAAVS